MAGGIFQHKDIKFKASLSYIRPCRKNNRDKKTQWVKVLAKQLCKPCNLRLIPGNHIKVEEEPTAKLFFDLSVSVCACLCIEKRKCRGQ